MNVFQNFVNDQFLPVGDTRLLTVHNPATGAPCAQVSLASAEQARAAVTSAARAQKSWGCLPGAVRARWLHLLADTLIAHSDAIGNVLARESGKSLADACAETLYAAELTHYQAEWGRRIEGDIIPSDNPGETLLLQRVAIGVVACLIPFNYPVYTLMRKIAPALIAGNTVVVRPSNNTPGSALELARAVKAAGLPPGVINILAMDHAVAELVCTDARVGMMTLTGSVKAGRIMMGYAQANIAKLSLELGGKTPVIVADDADLDSATDGIVASKTTHCGQVCTAAERVYAHRAVYPEVVRLLKQKMLARRYGDRALDAECMGPLVSAPARDALHAMVLRAVADGALIETGGFVPEGPGHFYPPTLLTQVRQDMEIVQQETFGPVLVVLPCDSMEEALALANDHQFGLSCVLFTERHATVMQFAGAIEAGELYVNRMPADPYQGYHAGWKRSGLGGDDGKHGMLEFTQTRLVVLPSGSS